MRGPRTKTGRLQVDKVIELAANTPTSIHNACEMVMRMTWDADGYRNEDTLFGYCNDHREYIEERIKRINANWKFGWDG